MPRCEGYFRAFWQHIEISYVAIQGRTASELRNLERRIDQALCALSPTAPQGLTSTKGKFNANHSSGFTWQLWSHRILANNHERWGVSSQRSQFPQDLPDWDSLSIEEKYQREISLRRVRNEIAPYFASDPDRFSGSLVLAVINDDQMLFEPLHNFGGGARNNVPQLYQSAAQNMGFLTNFKAVKFWCRWMVNTGRKLSNSPWRERMKTIGQFKASRPIKISPKTKWQ